MRTPTPLEKIYNAWAIGMRTGRTPCHEGEAEAGWFKMRMVAGGPWIPVRIWLEQEVEDGELIAPEIMRGTVDGIAIDPRDVWDRCCDSPIAEHEWKYLTALRTWQKINEPELWDPYRPVDMTRTAIEE